MTQLLAEWGNSSIGNCQHIQISLCIQLGKLADSLTSQRICQFDGFSLLAAVDLYKTESLLRQPASQMPAYVAGAKQDNTHERCSRIR